MRLRSTVVHSAITNRVARRLVPGGPPDGASTGIGRIERFAFGIYYSLLLARVVGENCKMCKIFFYL